MQFFKWLGTKLCDFGNWVWSGPQQSHPTLFQLRSFWVVAGLPIIIALIVGFCIFKSLGYPDLILTKEGFDNAYEYFKIPLWIAALSLPLAGFYASHHRSVETAKQISIATKQMEMAAQKNSFENCLKHRELFSDFIKKLEVKYCVRFSDLEFLYKKLFPKNDFNGFSYKADHSDFFHDFEISLEKYNANLIGTGIEAAPNAVFYFMQEKLLLDGYKDCSCGDFEEGLGIFYPGSESYYREFHQFISVINCLIYELYRYSVYPITKYKNAINDDLMKTGSQPSYFSEKYFFDVKNFAPEPHDDPF